MGPGGKARISDCNFPSYLDMLSMQLGFRSSSRCPACDVALAKSRRMGGGMISWIMRAAPIHAPKRRPRRDDGASGSPTRPARISEVVNFNKGGDKHETRQG